MLSDDSGTDVIAFCMAAQGATALFRIDARDGDVVAELAIQGATFRVADESPEHQNFGAESLDGATTPFVVVIRVSNGVHVRTLKAGAKQVRPVRQENGSLIGRVVTPALYILTTRDFSRTPSQSNKVAADHVKAS